MSAGGDIPVTPLLKKTPLNPWLLFAALVVFLAASCTPEQRAVLEQINIDRAAMGQELLIPDQELIDHAQAWADTMAADGDLRHSPLNGDGLPSGWSVIGENVGTGADLASIQDAFLGSPAHRANMLDARFDTMGSGVAVGSDGQLWVVQLFAQYEPGAAAA